jgi:hypothetical protein
METLVFLGKDCQGGVSTDLKSCLQDVEADRTRATASRSSCRRGVTGVVDVIVSNRWGLENPPGTQLEIT